MRARAWSYCISVISLITTADLQGQGQVFRISNLKLEPITYENGPGFAAGTHAYFTFDMMPGEGLDYLNARVVHPSGSFIWAARNIPIPPLDDIQPLTATLNLEAFEGAPYEELTFEIDVSSSWQTDPAFPPSAIINLIPEPVTYTVTSGSDDPPLSIGPALPPILPPPPIIPPIPGIYYRGCTVYNIDLDSTNNYPPSSPIASDINACGPAAAANSLQWLVKQHPELSGDTTSLRTKTDALKKFMNLTKYDTNGVRFDSMVVGKLTLIDTLKLPIRVKYKTKHESGNTGEPLTSLIKKYGHAADNQGSLGVYPDFDWYKSEMDAGEDVEVHVGWYDPPDSDGMRMRHGGHWLVGTGYFDGDTMKGVYLKDDDNQKITDTSDLRHKYYGWDTLPGSIPYLDGLTDQAGRIGVVESLVSESYDPNVLFTDVSKYDWSYRPVIYLSGSIQEGYPYHAWLTFTAQSAALPQLINARICHPDTALELWAVRNLPSPVPDIEAPPIRFKMDLGPLAVGDTLPDRIIMKYHIGGYHEDADFPVHSVAILDAQPEPFLVPSGTTIGFHPLIPSFLPIPLTIPNPPEIDVIFRGCEVPNIDLDSTQNMDDWNACGPAAIANSMQWLDDQHEEIDIPFGLRDLLDSLYQTLGHTAAKPVTWDSIIIGKLAFIDKYKLPIHVKYQAHKYAPGEIPSPDPLYGHKATNESPPDPDEAGAYLHPTYEWLCQELMAGEDVEIMFGYYCDTLVLVDVIDTIEYVTLPDGTIVADTFYITELQKKKKRESGHMFNITGKVSVGPAKWITYKHDVHQGDRGGTTDDNTPDSLRFTDISEWVEVDGGYVELLRESYIQADDDTCTAFVELVVSESYDPDIEFCVEDAFLPHDDGEGSLRAAIACAKPGDTISLTATLAGDTICLTSGPLEINKNVVIKCDPALQIYIQGKTVDRVFEIAEGVTVTFDGLRVICGEAEGAACVQNAGNATLRDVQFYGHDGILSEATQVVNTGTIQVEGNTNLAK